MSQAQTPPSTASSGHSPISPDPNHRIVRKRNRIPLSCGPCRSRKLKCNRSHPCDNCIKRGDTASCQYAQPGSRLRKGSSNGLPTSPDEMQTRIDRLESLVLSLMTNGAQAPGQAAAQAALAGSSASPSTEQSQDAQDIAQRFLEAQHREEDSDVEAVSRSIGVMKVQHDRQFFASEAHWWAILSDIAEVKRYFEEHKKQYEEHARKVTASKPGDTAPGVTLLFKGLAKVDRNEILSNFPARPVANALIQRYFDSENPAARIVHGPSFKADYEAHWNNPSSSTVAWLGMCFAMMSLALQSYQRVGDEPQELRGQTWAEALHYLEWTTQCLVSADFTSPTNCVLETLCLYLQAEQNRSKDAETGVWMLCGLVARLSLRMGLHRDPAPYAAISPWMGEMRRRQWNFIRSADIILSMQVGLPQMLRSEDSDTQLPRNMYDNEFSQDSKALPTTRPLSECTPMSFMIANCRLVAMLGRVLEHANSMNAPGYEAAMKLDGELDEARDQIPTQLRLKSQQEAAFDSASVIMERYTLDLTYHKTVISLHRKYLARARDNTRYSYSRRKCIDSCMQILAHQTTLHTECQPGRRLQSIPWSTNSSVNTADFLLAAMIICLDLYHTAQAETKGHTSGEYYEWAVEQREPMLSTIERAVALWTSLCDHSMEAYKAKSILTVMLEKLKNHQALRAQLGNNFTFAPVGGGQSPDRPVGPEHSAAMTLGLMSSGLTPDALNMYDRAGMNGPPRQGYPAHMANGEQAQAGMPSAAQEVMSPFAQLNTLFPTGLHSSDLPHMTLDWDAWDTFVQGSGGAENGVQNMMFDPALADNNGGSALVSQVDPKTQWVNSTPNVFTSAGNSGQS